jgi:hypothetical protein
VSEEISGGDVDMMAISLSRSWQKEKRERKEGVG